MVHITKVRQPVQIKKWFQIWLAWNRMVHRYVFEMVKLKYLHHALAFHEWSLLASECSYVSDTKDNFACLQTWLSYDNKDQLIKSYQATFFESPLDAINMEGVLALQPNTRRFLRKNHVEAILKHRVWRIRGSSWAMLAPCFDRPLVPNIWSKCLRLHRLLVPVHHWLGVRDNGDDLKL